MSHVWHLSYNSHRWWNKVEQPPGTAGFVHQCCADPSHKQDSNTVAASVAREFSQNHHLDAIGPWQPGYGALFLPRLPSASTSARSRLPSGRLHGFTATMMADGHAGTPGRLPVRIEPLTLDEAGVRGRSNGQILGSQSTEGPDLC